MNDAPENEGLPPSLRFLKGLVIALTLTMIVGVITVVAVIVTRMPAAFSAGPRLPENLKLPEGTKAEAVTFGKDWVAVVTSNDHILLFDADGRLRHDVQIAP